LAYDLKKKANILNFNALCGLPNFESKKIRHLISLADVRTRHSVDPIGDMRPLCPNCGAVIHKREPAFTVDEVNNILINAKKGT
jgi:5-methylcytosine-specific restriction protein A